MLSELQARDGLKEVETRLNELQTERSNWEGLKEYLFKDIKRLTGDVSLCTAEVERQIETVESEISDTEKKLKELEKKERTLQTRADEFNKVISEIKNDQNQELYNRLNAEIYNHMNKYNRFANKANGELERMQDLLKQLPKVQTDVQRPDGGWVRVIDLLPPPYENNRVFNQKIPSLRIINEKFYEEKEESDVQ